MASTPYEPPTPPPAAGGTSGGYAGAAEPAAPPPPAQDWSTDTNDSQDQSTTDAAKGEASRLKDTAAQTGSDLADTAKEQAAQVTSDAKDQAKQLADEARNQLNDHAGSQMQRAADNLRSLSDELSGMADHSEQSGMGAQLARQGGDLADRAAGYLEDRQPGDLVEDLRDFARRRPGTFIVGAAVAGVLVGRLTRGVQRARSNGSSDSGPAPTSGRGSEPGSDWIESQPAAATTRLDPVRDPTESTYGDPAPILDEPYGDQPPPPGYAGGSTGVTP